MGLLNVQAIVHKGIYLALWCVAVYLIVVGDIIQKFSQKRTNFAEYAESLTEWPTILAFVEYSKPNETLQYGKDFNLTAHTPETWAKHSKGYNLTIGSNDLSIHKICHYMA